MEQINMPVLIIIAVALALLAMAVLVARVSRATPVLITDPVADMALKEIQSWLAEEADLPVDQASHALRVLRGRPDILRRLEELPAIKHPAIIHQGEGA